MRAAIYARVSTLDQQPENQLAELRRYVAARGWDGAVEYVDHGVSGAKDRRPALDQLVKDARRRKFDVLVTLEARSARAQPEAPDHAARGPAGARRRRSSSLGEGIDATTPAGKLQMHILGAIAEFERGRIVERVRAGLARARAQGQRLGRPKARVPVERLQTVAGLSVDDAARTLAVSRSTLKRWRRQVQQSLPA